ncbi:hypothetical protein, partial [Staphylococcus sp. GDY8P97P]|uniref:hypothetical protein n=1 Tax=Staphylococcus sp. GDY8P97P TaxID=2804428 RepID=UPI001951D27C
GDMNPASSSSRTGATLATGSAAEITPGLSLSATARTGQNAPEDHIRAGCGDHDLCLGYGIWVLVCMFGKNFL